MIICRLARQQIKVVMTGDGGDELFAGYRRYQQTLQLRRRMRSLPRRVRHVLSGVLAMPSPSMYHRLQPLQSVFGSHVHEGLAESVRKSRSLLTAGNDRELYECLASISYNANGTNVLTSSAFERTCDSAGDYAANVWQEDWELLANMQLWDSQIYLPNDILYKVDIASMAVGLEARVPLLDHRLYEHAWRVPDRLKVDQHRGKLLLRRVLDRYLPESLFERPKRGFSAPLDGWLRGPLRDWAEGLLDSSSLDSSGLLQAATARSYWDDLIRGRAGHARVWPILVFLAWQQRYLSSSASEYEHRVRNASNDSLCIGS